MSCCLLLLCQRAGEPGWQLCCHCHHHQETTWDVRENSVEAWRGGASTSWHPGDVPTPPIPAGGSRGSRKPQPPQLALGTQPRYACTFPLPSPLVMCPVFRLGMAEKSWKCFAVYVAKIWPNPVCSGEVCCYIRSSGSMHRHHSMTLCWDKLVCGLRRSNMNWLSCSNKMRQNYFGEQRPRYS